MSKNKHPIKQIVSGIVTAILIVSTILCFVVTLKAALGDKAPGIFGFRFFYVVTESMVPTISVGNTVIVRSASEYEKDEIITFVSASGAIEGKPNTHRVVEVLRDGDRITGYRTQGDANQNPDAEIVTPDRIYGKVICILENAEGMNRFLSFLSTKYGFFLILILPVVVLAIIAMKDFMKAKNKLREELQAASAQDSESKRESPQNQEDKEERP